MNYAIILLNYSMKKYIMAHITLDKTDRKILAILQSDGRLSNQEVAERVNL